MDWNVSNFQGYEVSNSCLTTINTLFNVKKNLLLYTYSTIHGANK